MEENEPQRRMGAPGKPLNMGVQHIKLDDSNRLAIPKLDELEKRVEALESKVVGKETTPATLDDVVEQIRRLGNLIETLIKGQEVRNETIAAVARTAYNPQVSELSVMLNGSVSDKALDSGT